MSNPAFIVDGQMEKLIIESICPGKPVRLLSCNGRDVSLAAAAKKASSLIRLLKNNYPIILIFDRECRTESSEEISAILKEKIQAELNGSVDIRVGVPDRMIENWVLSDPKAIENHYGIPQTEITETEGTNGKSKLRSMIGEKKYGEVEDGPTLWNNCSRQRMTSPSLNSFLSRISDLSCKWLTT